MHDRDGVRHGDVRRERQRVRAVGVVAQRHAERLAERRVGALDARHDVRHEALAALLERQTGAVDRRDADRQRLADDGALDVAKRKRAADVELALARQTAHDDDEARRQHCAADGRVRRVAAGRARREDNGHRAAVQRLDRRRHAVRGAAHLDGDIAERDLGAVGGEAAQHEAHLGANQRGELGRAVDAKLARHQHHALDLGHRRHGRVELSAHLDRR